MTLTENTAARAPTGARSPRFARYLPLVAVLGLALLAFCQAPLAGYVDWDDSYFVVNNTLLNTGFPEAVSAFFGHYFMGDYLPLTLFSFWAEVHAVGRDASVQHAVNLALHLANVTLLFNYLRYWRLDLPARMFVAAVFAVHPLQTEVVMWISERKGLLAVFFALLAMHAFARARSDRRLRHVYLLCYGLSLLSKATAVFLPVLLFAEDVLLRHESVRRAARKQALALTIGVGWVVLRVVAYGQFTAGFSASLSSATYWLDLPWRVLGALGFYVEKLFVPVGLSIIYPPFLGLGRVWPGVLVALATVAVLAYFIVKRRSRRLAYFAVFSMVFLLPVLQVVPRINYVNDRYMYLPVVGAAAALAVIVGGARRSAPALPVVGVLVIAALAVLSFARSSVWLSNEGLWTDTLLKNPKSSIAHMSLAGEYARQGRPREAIPLYEQGAELGKREGTAQVALDGLGVTYSSPRFPEVRDDRLAEQALLASLRMSTQLQDTFSPRYHLAVLDARTGRRDVALRQALALRSDLDRTPDASYAGLRDSNARLIRSLETAPR